VSTSASSSSFSRTKIAIGDILNAAGITDAMTGGGVYIADFESVAVAINSFNLGSEEIAAWCITIADNVAEQPVVPAYRYDNFGFNSFIEIDGKQHGLADDGLYELSGSTDDGDEIPASFVIPREMFADSDQRIEMMYVRAESKKQIAIKVRDASGCEYEYETEWEPGDKSNLRRVEVGKGLIAGEWDIVVENKKGEYMEVYDVLVKPIILRRRRGGKT
jgi:hypothetical protein